MKFLVKGIIKKKSNGSFSMEAEANSEKHAKELILIKLGSRYRAKKTQINIESIEKVK